ncbi:hypothetical protein Taro_021968 [Colocasia esculenta]|uniref:Major facilitator superfamily (MFS) profile domain-containing protein n=1 Tax=Colocasia esculenta TaxID=4460 RepID=A0A843V0F3_COLES|nr:hypothetical protein [Colocasia esculenta]
MPQSVPVYLSEMAPARYRGMLNIGFQLMITIGILVANLINYGTAKIKGGWGWRVSLAGAAVPAAIITLGSVFLPDTPNSLIDRGKEEEAREMLRRIRGTTDIDCEYQDLVEASNQSRAVQHPWANIIQRKYRPQLAMAILIPFFQQLTGINVIMFYAPVLFKTIGFGDNASLMFAVITGLVNVFATLVSVYYADRAGRRKLFLEGGTQMLICQILVGTLIWKEFGTTGHRHVSKGMAIIIVALICVFVSGFAWSWGPLGWLVPSEIFPLEIRSAGQAINVSVNMFFTFVIAQVFLSLLCHFKFCLFYFFGGWVIVMTIFIYFFLPETKNIPIGGLSMICMLSLALQLRELLFHSFYLERIKNALNRLAGFLYFVGWNERFLAKVKKSNERTVSLVKASMDMVVAIGLLQLAPKKVTPRITGAFGFLSSLIFCCQLLPARPKGKSS